MSQEGFLDETGQPQVKVLMDGREVHVPARVGSWLALRGALGVPRGMGVAIKSVVEEGMFDEAYGAGHEAWAILGPDEIDRPGENVRYWEFNEGDEYKTLSIQEALDMGLAGGESEEDPWGLAGDWWKKGS